MRNRGGAAHPILVPVLSGVCPGLLCGALLFLSTAIDAAQADSGGRQVEFNPAFLQGSAKVDVSRFSRGNPVLPGDYLVDLRINGKWVTRITVRFIGQPGSDIARPCIDRAIFDRVGVDLDKLPQGARAALQKAGSDGCIDVAGLITDATVTFEMSALRLDISVPQASLEHRPRDFVSPEFWDVGIPSFTMGYNMNAYRTGASSGSITRGHASFLAGANYASWHLRHRGSVDVVSGGSATYHSAATYLLHDIPAIRSNLTIGDNFTDGAVFDSFAFRGVSLVSSDQMLPDSQRDFAPVVRGIARTNARVVIAQNGVTLLETTVSPGPFEINDLYATGYGGDIKVVIYEADGSQESFYVPYAPMPQLLRPGIWRYTATAGQLRLASSSGSDLFAKATLQRGISSALTGYGGALGAQHYGAALAGIAVNTRMGALSVDLAQARTSLDAGVTYSGQTLRLSYSKLLRASDTSITFTAYPYVSDGYYSLTESQAVRQAVAAGADPASAVRLRRQWQLGINQNLPRRWGNFFVSASVRDYWNSSRSVTQLQGGYTNQLRFAGLRLSYGIALARQINALTGDHDNRVQVNFSYGDEHSHRPFGRSASIAGDLYRCRHRETGRGKRRSARSHGRGNKLRACG